MKKFLSLLIVLATVFPLLAFGATRLVDADFLMNGSKAQRNYIKDGEFERNVNGVSAYADAAGTAPVDATGGSPSLTCTRTTSSPLRGDGSLLITKGASNRQGDGCAIAFTTDASDNAQVLQISFDYSIASGTFADNDLAVYLYDVTGSTVIQPAPYSLTNAASGLPQRWIGVFQVPNGSTSFRLAIHASSTSASAYTVKVDNVRVGPQNTSYGAYISDWKSYTPSTTFTNTTNTGFYRFVGDTMEVIARAAYSSASSAQSTFTFSIPSGFTIDTAKLTSSSSLASEIGKGTYQDAAGGTTRFVANVFYDTTSTVRVRYLGSNFSTIIYENLDISTTAPATWASGNYIEVRFSVPIVGKSSGQVLSSDADNRVVSFMARSTSGSMSGSLSGAYNKATFGTTTLYDTHGKYSGGTYTIPVSGYYDIAAQMAVSATWSATNVFYCAIYKNGSNFIQNRLNSITVTSDNYCYVNAKSVYLDAGATIEIYTYVNGSGPTWSGDATTNYFSVTRASGPSQIAATETISARYSNVAGTSITSSETAVPFATKDWDTHGAFATDTFTAPISGIYDVNATVVFAASTYVVGEYASLAVFANSTEKHRSNWSASTTSSTYVTLTANTKVRLLAGQTIQVKARNDHTVALNSNANLNYIAITRVGNY